MGGILCISLVSLFSFNISFASGDLLTLCLVDQTKKHEIERRIAEAKTMRTEGKVEFENLEEELARWQQQWNKAKNELNVLNERRANIQRVLKQIESLGLRLGESGCRTKYGTLFADTDGQNPIVISFGLRRVRRRWIPSVRGFGRRSLGLQRSVR